MTSADWEAANEDDSDRWACYEAQTGLVPPIPATYTPASDRVVWRDRGERIAALEAENAALAAAVSEAQTERDEARRHCSGLHDAETEATLWKQRAESAEAEVERLREVEEGIRALAGDFDTAVGFRGAATSLRALLSPAPAATTGEAIPECAAEHPTNTSAVPCVRDVGHEGSHMSTTGCGGSVMHWPHAPVSSGSDLPTLSRLPDDTDQLSGRLLEGVQVMTPEQRERMSNPVFPRVGPVSSGEAATGEAYWASHTSDGRCQYPDSCAQNPTATGHNHRPAPVVTPSAEESE